MEIELTNEEAILLKELLGLDFGRMGFNEDDEDVFNVIYAKLDLAIRNND